MKGGLDDVPTKVQKHDGLVEIQKVHLDDLQRAAGFSPWVLSRKKRKNKKKNKRELLLTDLQEVRCEIVMMITRDEELPLQMMLLVFSFRSA